MIIAGPLSYELLGMPVVPPSVGMMSGVVLICQAGTITSDAPGSWGIYTGRGVVSAEATRIMGRYPHHCKGASTNCDWGGPLGGTVELYTVCVTTLPWWRSFGLGAVGMSE